MSEKRLIFRIYKVVAFLWGFAWAVTLLGAVLYFSTGTQAWLLFTTICGLVATQLYPFHATDAVLGRQADGE